MTIEFHCDGCQKLLRTSADKAGLRAKCPHCGMAITTPYPAGEEPFEDYETSPAFRNDWDLNENADDDPFSQHFGSGGSPTSTAVPYQSTASTVAKKPCPMCGEPIAASAQHCPFCGERMGNAASFHPGRSHALPTSGMAVASLVLGIVGLAVFCIPGVNIVCSLLALVFGILGWNQTRNATHQGEGAAIAGLVLGGLALMASALALAVWLLGNNGGF